jgi:hypothetical protein
MHQHEAMSTHRCDEDRIDARDFGSGASDSVRDARRFPFIKIAVFADRVASPYQRGSFEQDPANAAVRSAATAEPPSRGAR